jgi:hypothetical protein
MSEIMRLRYEAQTGILHGAGFLSISEDMVRATDYDALLAERDALRADAERYRWLRNESRLAGPFNEAGEMVWPVIGISGAAEDRPYPVFGDDLDSAVDAALSKRDGEQHG